MKRWIVIAVALLCIVTAAMGQRTTFTGTVVIYGSGFNTRTTTSPFRLVLNGRTSADEAQRLLGALQNGGQDELQRSLSHGNVGQFAIGGRVGVPVEAAVVDNAADGRIRIRAVMERWQGFGELWRGGRSVDYPFSYVELFVDPRTGNGEGTFIAAAQIRWRNNKGQNQVEIEDFGTFPGRLVGVRMNGRIPV
ncbi:MAG: hypothetical protein JO314_13310 [Acidobacteria bacterium]|nr:hypothetical protein [Acidobacteriota bacterium]